jgi:predicted enzyme related to lactoylglutathione lyase
MRPHTSCYFEIANCDSITATVRELGAKAYMEPMTMEEIGRWSVMADSQAAVFASFQLVPHHPVCRSIASYCLWEIAS